MIFTAEFLETCFQPFQTVFESRLKPVQPKGKLRNLALKIHETCFDSIKLLVNGQNRRFVLDTMVLKFI